MRPTALTRRDFLRHTYALDAARSGYPDAMERANLLVSIDDEIDAREFTRVEAALAIGADPQWFSQLADVATHDLAAALERIAALPRIAQPRG